MKKKAKKGAKLNAEGAKSKGDEKSSSEEDEDALPGQAALD